MKVYLVITEHNTGSWGDRDCYWIEGIVDSEEKAREKIEQLSKSYLSEAASCSELVDYPKIVKDENTEIKVADSCYEDQDYTSFRYTEYEVG